MPNSPDIDMKVVENASPVKPLIKEIFSKVEKQVLFKDEVET